jgi:transposase-like protein
MAPPQSALSELLDAIRAGGDTDVLREAMALVLQELIELEAAQAIGAARYERSDERTTHRNGSRSRLLSTKAGDVLTDALDIVVGDHDGSLISHHSKGHGQQELAVSMLGGRPHESNS